MAYLPELSLKKYRIDEMVGLGTAARVYKAFNLETEEVVAIKAPIVHSRRGGNEALSETFIKEYDLLSHLALIAPHCTPYMTCVHALGTLPDSAFQAATQNYLKKKKRPVTDLTIYNGKVTCMVMEYLPGHPLADIKVKLKKSEFLCVAKALFSGLIYMHSLNLIHNDLDETNVYFTAGRLLLIDFEKSCSYDLARKYKDSRFICKLQGNRKMLNGLSEEEKLEYAKKFDVTLASNILYFLAHQKERGIKPATLPSPELAQLIDDCAPEDWRDIPTAKEVLEVLEEAS